MSDTESIESDTELIESDSSASKALVCCTRKRRLSQAFDEAGNNVQDVQDLGQPASKGREYMMATTTRTASSVSRDESGMLRVSNEAVVRYGHSYQRVLVEGQARVHMGDSITVNYHYGEAIAAHGNAKLEDDVDTLSRVATELVLEIKAKTIRFLRILQRKLSGSEDPVPDRLQSQTVLFEDALGRFQQIDTRFIADWTSFDFVLCRAFRGQLGSEHVANAGYRLLTEPMVEWRPVDPHSSQHRPAFADIFKPGQHVRMAIHFDIGNENCPLCDSQSQSSFPYEDERLLCDACGHSYQITLLKASSAGAFDSSRKHMRLDDNRSSAVENDINNSNRALAEAYANKHLFSAVSRTWGSIIDDRDKESAASHLAWHWIQSERV